MATQSDLLTTRNFYFNGTSVGKENDDFDTGERIVTDIHFPGNYISIYNT